MLNSCACDGVDTGFQYLIWKDICCCSTSELCVCIASAANALVNVSFPENWISGCQLAVVNAQEQSD